MPTVTSTSIVPASAEEAFSFIDDYRNIPHLQPHFTSARLVGDVDKQVGAEVALEGRFHGMPMKAVNRIIAYEPPFRLVSISQGAVLSRSTWQLEELSTDPPSTRVTLTVDYRLNDALGGLFRGVGSMLWHLFNREIQGMTDDSLRRLRAMFEDDRRRTSDDGR